MTRYHHAAYTLDKEIGDEEQAPLSAGFDPEAAEEVREASNAFREGRQEAAEAEEERLREWNERDPKPTPSQLEVERGQVPVPEDYEASESAPENAPGSRREDKDDDGQQRDEHPQQGEQRSEQASQQEGPPESKPSRTRQRRPEA